jgi:hypothetical protein
MVNANYHKSINKTLIARNYFDDFFKGLLLGKRLPLRNNHPEPPGFAIDILRSFRKSMTNVWSILSVINSTTSVMRSRAWQSELGASLRIVIGPTTIR